MLLEDDQDPRLAVPGAVGNELGREHGLARAGGAADEHGVPSQYPPSQQRVQTRDARRDTASPQHPVRLGDGSGHAREDLEAGPRDAERMEPWHRRLAARLHDLELAHDRVMVGALEEPDDPVGDGEHRGIAQLHRRVLANQKGRGAPARQVDGQPLHELVQGHLASLAGGPLHALKRVHDHEAGAQLLDLPDDAVQHHPRASVQDLVRQIDEVDAAADLTDVEETHLLLVAEHLDGWLAEQRDVDRRALGGGVGEHDLVGQGRLPSPGRAGDQVEGVLGQPAAQHLVKARHAGW